MKRIAKLSLITACLAAPACHMPDDGVLSISFLLEAPPPSDTRVFPPEAETGVAPFDLRSAVGRCRCDVPARTVTCSFEGLPPVSRVTGERLGYELSFLMYYGPLSAGFDARDIDRDPGGHNPDLPPPMLPPPLPRQVVGPVLPDAVGSAPRTFSDPALPLDRVAGGELHLIVPATADTPARRHLVIDGRVGNWVEEGGGASEPAPSPTGGHQH